MNIKYILRLQLKFDLGLPNRVKLINSRKLTTLTLSRDRLRDLRCLSRDLLLRSRDLLLRLRLLLSRDLDRDLDLRLLRSLLYSDSSFIGTIGIIGAIPGGGTIKFIPGGGGIPGGNP